MKPDRSAFWKGKPLNITRFLPNFAFSRPLAAHILKPCRCGLSGMLGSKSFGQTCAPAPGSTEIAPSPPLSCRASSTKVSP